MRKLFLVTLADDEIGEVEGIFDSDKFTLLHWWNLNDADWRSEYFNPLMEQLGIKVVSSNNRDMKKRLALNIKRDMSE